MRCPRTDQEDQTPFAPYAQCGLSDPPARVEELAYPRHVLRQMEVRGAGLQSQRPPETGASLRPRPGETVSAPASSVPASRARLLAAYTSLPYALGNCWDPNHLRTANRLLAPEVGMRLLEVGCGRGHLTRRLQEQGLDAVGIDANPHAVEHGVAPHLLVMQAEALDFPDASFDLLCSFHAIEHVGPLDRALAEMARVIRPGGRLLLVYPAEPIQGLYAIPSAVVLYHNPFQAAQVHCHRLTPARLRQRVTALPLEHLRSEFHLHIALVKWIRLRTPEFCSLFRRL
jgi:SAM-dependent methyltransferase